MRKYILFIVFLLLIPVYLWATDGVNTVEHPAKVNSVATPDKVNTVEGLAAAEGCSGEYGSTLGTDSSVGTYTNKLILVKATIDCSDTADYIGIYHTYSNSEGREIRGVIYSDNAGTPNKIVALTNYAVTAVAGTPTISDVAISSGGTVASGTYWVGCCTDSATNYPKFPYNYADYTAGYDVITLTGTECADMVVDDNFSDLTNDGSWSVDTNNTYTMHIGFN